MGFRVIGFDVSKPAMASAKEYGADEVVNSSDAEATKAALERLTGGDGLDSSIVTSGVPAAFTGAIALTGFNG